MVDAVTVRRRLRKLDRVLSQLRELGGIPRETFLEDEVKQAAAAWLLQTATQIVLDIGSHLLAGSGVIDWEEYRQIPRGLEKLGVVPGALAGRLEKAAGQRNILVHMYLDVDPGLIHDTLKSDLDAFAEFAECVVRAVGR